MVSSASVRSGRLSIRLYKISPARLIALEVGCSAYFKTPSILTRSSPFLEGLRAASSLSRAFASSLRPKFKASASTSRSALIIPTNSPAIISSTFIASKKVGSPTSSSKSHNFSRSASLVFGRWAICSLSLLAHSPLIPKCLHNAETSGSAPAATSSCSCVSPTEEPALPSPDGAAGTGAPIAAPGTGAPIAMTLGIVRPLMANGAPKGSRPGNSMGFIPAAWPERLIMPGNAVGICCPKPATAAAMPGAPWICVNPSPPAGDIIPGITVMPGVPGTMPMPAVDPGTIPRPGIIARCDPRHRPTGAVGMAESTGPA
mmetsp:Transcript_21910/g.61232  ORF Transcript_21910/g.61232 Transcript_21910/m.61232 type:complete len:316 (+) Transcript_21910:490-1437(+)